MKLVVSSWNRIISGRGVSMRPGAFCIHGGDFHLFGKEDGSL